MRFVIFTSKSLPRLLRQGAWVIYIVVTEHYDDPSHVSFA
jgi:hypothetical protein